MDDSPEVPFEIVAMQVQGQPAIFLYGELDMMAAPKLHEGLTALIQEGVQRVLVDLANVTFIDSTALGTLVVADRHLQEHGGELRLVAVPNAVAKVFEITQLDKRFNIYTDADAASAK